MKSLQRTTIDYIRDSEELIGRAGYVLNIITGCAHGCPYCYARKTVLEGRLKGHPSYPYDFAPTFHPERIGRRGGKKKLIFLNDMGDVGGEWDWRVFGSSEMVSPVTVVDAMKGIAEMNPEHIMLLLTKNPVWYRHGPWPENIYCGFTATDNGELALRLRETLQHVPADHIWISLEPWLDKKPADCLSKVAWLIIGGLSGRDGAPVSIATTEWLSDDSIQIPRFVKENSGWSGIRKEYPESW